MAKAKRQSGIELLRIIAMVQIIYLHLYQYAGLRTTSMALGDIDGFITTFAWDLCRTPVDVFIMISGYFMITAKFDIKKTWNKVGSVWGAMIFYSLAISVIYFIVHPHKVNGITIAGAFVPFFSRRWYFLTNYIIVMLLSPFINKLLVSLTKKQYQYLLGLTVVIFSLWATIAKVDVLDEIFGIHKVLDPYYGKSLTGFLMMYVIGGYLRLYHPQKTNEDGKQKPNVLYIIAFFVLCIIDTGLYYLAPEYKHVFGMFNNPIVLAESVLLILFFRDLNFSSKIVNTIAGTTLGIYIIHEHPYVREWIWGGVINFKGEWLYDTLIYIPLAIIACAVVFAICSCIELGRVKLFDYITRLFTYDKKK